MNRDNFFGYSVRLSQLSQADGGGWVASIPELRGCLADGRTPDEAYEELKSVLDFWLEVAKEEGKPVPQPMAYSATAYSGRIMLRMPKTLHRILAEQAEHEDVSLNQYMVALLSYNASRLQQNATKEQPKIVHVWVEYVKKEMQQGINRSKFLDGEKWRTPLLIPDEWERVARHEL